MHTVPDRFTVYAAAHGKTRDEMLAYDASRFPGAQWQGFIQWLNVEWRAYDETCNSGVRPLSRDLREHQRFNEWLARRWL